MLDIIFGNTARDVYITLGILFIAYIGSKVLRKVIRIIFYRIEEKATSKKIISKTKTLKSLVNSIGEGSLVVVTFLTILAQWGVNILPLLTGLGILGLGFSLGAQTLFKDVIAGFFIIVENQFNVGDRIKVGDFEGEVVKITLRLTVLKDKKGNAIYLPNSQVTSVVRYTN